MVNPFEDPRFLASIAVFAGRLGYANRTDAMHAVFADLLPPALIGRPAKAYFRRTFWGPESRSFGANWDGQHVDPELVHIEQLLELWRGPEPHPGSMLLLQSVWLAEQHQIKVTSTSAPP